MAIYGDFMGFIDSYKHLEKLCGEVLNDDRRLSAYIDEMLSTPRGSDLVAGWDDDLKQLKHYRWIRNKIVHEPNCCEENMCELSDALWLDKFYLRIMNQKDPLSLYARATKPRQAHKTQRKSTQTSAYHNKYSDQQPKGSHKKTSKTGCCAALVIFILAIIVIFVLIYNNIGF